MRSIPRTLLLVALTASAGFADSNLQRDTRQWSRCATVVMLQDKRIDESSGICASRVEDGVYYTHNDSGDTARFFKFDRKGRTLAVYNVANAFTAVDWEDIASATIGGKPYVFCGDIGDNAEKRRQIYVYRIPEPARRPSENGDAQDVRADRVYTLTYPDRAHNAEALMVNPITGDIVIVTKTSDGPSSVFELPRPGASGEYKLRKVGEISVGGVFKPGRLITGGDISPDARHVVLRGYLEAWEFDVPSPFEGWVRSKPRTVQTNADPQGEGICYSRNGRSLLTTSEGVPCQVSEAKLVPGKND